MLKIGLTGGIGSGKSTVAMLFSEKGIPVVDADTIAHQLVEPGQPALRKIISCFDQDILDADGRLNRAKLREVVFRSPERRELLESILHPMVYNEIQRQISVLTSPYCVISIPLLLETEKRQLVDRVLVVDCPVEQQYARVMARDNLAKYEVQRVIASQVSRERRLAAADDIIDNSAGIEQLRPQVDQLHQYYLSLAALPEQSPDGNG
jgi:dephospho-CoA kinase